MIEFIGRQNGTSGAISIMLLNAMQFFGNFGKNRVKIDILSYRNPPPDLIAN